MRNVSTHSGKGISAVLQKNPDDVVITFAKRTAMGRNRKGQFKDIPVDEMMQALLKVDWLFVDYLQKLIKPFKSQATFEKTKLDPAKLDDICVGKWKPHPAMYFC